MSTSPTPVTLACRKDEFRDELIRTICEAIGLLEYGELLVIHLPPNDTCHVYQQGEQAAFGKLIRDEARVPDVDQDFVATYAIFPVRFDFDTIVKVAKPVSVSTRRTLEKLAFEAQAYGIRRLHEEHAE